MSTTTTNLGLFKYNTTTDANVAFSITNALNNNWDKIDTAIANISGVTTTASGRSWYRQWSNGWKEQGGEVATSSSTQTWTTPSLSSNTSYGTISSSNSAQTVYTLFNGGAFDVPQGSATCYVYWTFPNDVKFATMKATDGFVSGVCQGADKVTLAVKSNNTWTDVGSITLSSGGSSQRTTNLTQVQTNQIRLTISATVTVWPSRVKDIIFTGTEYITAYNTITFPISFNNTNYSYAFGCYGGSGVNVYVSSQTATGISLQASNATKASWIAMGY